MRFLRSCSLFMLLLFGIGGTVGGLSMLLPSFVGPATPVVGAVLILAAVAAFGLLGVIVALEYLAEK